MRKHYFLFNEGSVVNQVICAILINIPVFSYGTCIGWMSPMTLLLQSENSPREKPLTDFEVSWIGAAAYLVCIPADYIMAYLGDNCGRKKTLLLISASSAACWVIKLCSMEIWAFVLARVLVGIVMAGSYVTCPLYTKEISQDSIRGQLGSFITLFHTTGNLFIYIIGDLLSYRPILWICLSLPVFHIIMFLMMPDSPSYLIKQGKKEEAARVFAWLQCRQESDPVIQHEIDIIIKEQCQDSETSNNFLLRNILSDRILYRAFKIACVATIAREFCGAVPVMNYAGEIFKRASDGIGIIISPNQQAMVLAVVQVAGSSLASSVVEKTGRKSLLVVTSAVSGIGMTALASWFLTTSLGYSTPVWIPIFTLCLCIFCDSAGLQPASLILTNEIFSFKYRGTVLATSMAVASLVAFLQVLFFKPLASAIGVHASFYAFGLVCLLYTLYVLLVVPETKMKSLSEIYEKLKTKKEKSQECLEAEIEKKDNYKPVKNLKRKSDELAV